MSTEPDDSTADAPPAAVFVSMNVKPPARNALQRLTLARSAQAGRRLILSDVLLAAVAVAINHPDEHLAAIANPAPIGEIPL